jgi:hypothetical protein
VTKQKLDGAQISGAAARITNFLDLKYCDA